MFEQWKEKQALKKIRQFRDIEGWLTDKEAIALFRVAAKLPVNATVVEIGSWQGKSTYCISKGLRSGIVYAIDPFNADSGNDSQSQNEYNKKKGSKDLLKNFRKSMEQLGVLDKIVVKKGYSQQFHNDFDRINFLFIDGDHSIRGCVSDFDLYAKKIVPGGFIAFHDYYPGRPELGPTHVIKNLVLPSVDFTFFSQSDSMWIAKKTC